MGRLQLAQRPRRVLLHAAVALLLAAGCGGGSERPRVFAAASLTDVFSELGDADYVFDGSFALVRQLSDGADADVLVTADSDTMDLAVRGGLVSDPIVFAGNRLVIAVARGNPKGIRSLGDLHRVRVATAAAGVPVARYTEEVLRRARVQPLRGSIEPDVRAIVGKIALGEVDAGIVYRTDVKGNVEAVEIPPNHQVVVSYLAAALTDDGRAFVASLRSEGVQAMLAAHGFTGPP